MTFARFIRAPISSSNFAAHLMVPPYLSWWRRSSNQKCARAGGNEASGGNIGCPEVWIEPGRPGLVLGVVEVSTTLYSLHACFRSGMGVAGVRARYRFAHRSTYHTVVHSFNARAPSNRCPDGLSSRLGSAGMLGSIRGCW